MIIKVRILFITTKLIKIRIYNMGCVSEKPIVSKKIPVSILKKPGQKSNNATLANSAEIESI